MLGIAAANADAARVVVDQLAAVLARLVDGAKADQPDRRGAHREHPRLLRHALGQGQGNQLERGDAQEDVAGPIPPLLVLDDRGTHAGHPFDRAVGISARSDGQHGGNRAQTRPGWWRPDR